MVKPCFNKSQKKNKKTKKDPDESDQANKQLMQHALDTAHMPGVLSLHKLQAYDIGQLTIEQLDEMHTLPCLSHLNRETMEMAISHLGPTDAKGWGQFWLNRKNLFRKHGVSDADIDAMPIMLPLTSASQFNPLLTKFSMEFDPPFLTPHLPVSNEILQQLLDANIQKYNMLLAVSPILPIPVELGTLPHLTMQSILPPAMDCVKYMTYLYAMLDMFNEDATLHPLELRKSLMKDHMERRKLIDDMFEEDTSALAEQFFAENPDVKRDALSLTATIPDYLLVQLEHLCCSYTKAFVNCFEITIVEFLAEDARPCEVPGTYTAADGSYTVKLGDSETNTRRFFAGIPRDYINRSMFVNANMMPLEQIRTDVVTSLQLVTSGIQSARDSMFGIKADCSNLVAITNRLPEDTTPTYATLAVLRKHWQFIFSDTKFGETPFYANAESEYNTAIAATMPAICDAAAAAPVESGVLTVVENGIQEYSALDVPPMEPALESDLPDGGLMDE
jgi:hypothetical protein